MELSGSMQTECTKRLETLYNKHHQWLGAVAYNISKNQSVVEDLVSDLYLYLSEKCSPKLWYEDSFNLQYCRQFMQSRFINSVKRNSKIQNNPQPTKEDLNIVDEVYDEERDRRIDEAYDEVKQNLEIMKRSKGWSAAMIYEHYWFSDKTLDEVSKEIGISKSTVFLSTKKVKQKLKNNIQNPFTND